MDFGMMSYDGLTEDMFILKEMDQPFLSGTKTKAPEFYLGLSRWTYKEGEKFKPGDVKPGTLPYYANYFNSVELNASHYAIPEKDKVDKWYASVQQEFRFCPKFHKSISHQGILDKSKIGPTKLFIDRVSNFREKLGASFVQLHEKQSPEAVSSILEFVRAIPPNFELSVEIRHPDWFKEEKLLSFAKELAQLKKGLVITDTPGRRDAAHMLLSNSTAFIRLNCQGFNLIDMFRIEQWKKQLKSWYLQGLEKCYFFLHIHDESQEDDLINYAKEVLKF